MIKDTISANESLSAVEASKIASILPFSVAMSDANSPSTTSKEFTDNVKLALSKSLASILEPNAKSAAALNLASSSIADDKPASAASKESIEAF